MPPPVLVLACLVLFLVALPTHVASAGEEAPTDPVGKALASPQATGLLVTGVGPGTQAAALGVLPGDVLVTYDGNPTPSIAALRAAMQAVSAETLEVLVIRPDGSEKTFTLAPGTIGVTLAPVVKGKGVEPLPPATDVKFDFSSLAETPHDDWYAFFIGGQQAGFEHGLTHLQDGKLVMRREVAFDGGEQWGVNHFDVTVVLTAEPTPKTVSFSFHTPITGYAGEGEMTTTEEGRAVLRYTHTADAGESSTAEHAVPAALPSIPSYAVETLACFMPREKGACFHYRSITDGSGAIDNLPSALCVEGEEEVEIGGTAVQALKLRIHTTAGGPSNTFWLDARGRVVKADYMGAVATAAKKEDCLKDLHHGLVPRTAD